MTLSAESFRIVRGRGPTARSLPTFVFADLAGYTALTEQHGDETAAAVAHEFARVMRMLSRKHGARQIKTMGDGVMIWSPDADRAVALAAEALASFRTPPLRIGVHTGSAIRRGSDWFGSAVNVAARLADQAAPSEALISEATRTAICGRATHPLSACRELLLRGLERPVAAWRLT